MGNELSLVFFFFFLRAKSEIYERSIEVKSLSPIQRSWESIIVANERLG